MANVKDVKRGPIKITLSDGVEREMKFTLNALATLEEKYGSVQAAFDKLEESSVVALRTILFVGLHSTDADLTEEQVGDLIDVAHMEDIISSLGNTFSADMPAADADAAEGESPKA